MGGGVVQNRESPDFRSPEVGRYESREQFLLRLTLFLPYLRLTVKIFQFLRLSTKFLAVLRLSVNPIETLLSVFIIVCYTAVFSMFIDPEK